MSIEIVQATPADAEIISELATQTFYETYEWYNSAENMREYTNTHFNVEQTRAELNEAHTCFFLAKFDGQPAGYCKMRDFEHPAELKEKNYLEVERIYVLRALQDKKVGIALLQACVQKGKQLGLDCIWLGVWEKNAKAIEFYEKAGFKKFGRHIFMLGSDAQQDFLMKLDL